jgi:chorismate mutase
LFAKRFKVVEKVWEFKKDKNMDALQSWRWEEVLNSKIKIWTRKGLSEEFIKDTWNRIHKEALKIER